MNKRKIENNIVKNNQSPEINIHDIVNKIKYEDDRMTAANIINKFLSVVSISELIRIECIPSSDECNVRFLLNGDSGLNSNQISSLISFFEDQTVMFKIYVEKDSNNKYKGMWYDHVFVLGKNQYVKTYTTSITTVNKVRVQRGTADNINETQDFGNNLLVFNTRNPTNFIANLNDK